MRLFFIFSILCLLIAASEVRSETMKVQYSIARLIIAECLDEFDEKIAKNKDLSKKSNIDATCLYACGLRKWSEERGLTLYRGLLQMIDEAYKSGFQMTKSTRVDIISKVEICSAKESNECQLAKCVGIFGSPFADVYLHYITNN